MFQLNIEINARRFLLEGGQMERVQDLLRRRAPRWSAGLHIFRYPRERRPIDVTVPSSLAESLRTAVNQKGPRYQELVRLHGPPKFPRTLGGAELRGSGASLLVGIHVDEYPIAPSGREWIWGNSLAVTVSKTRVEGEGAIIWSARVFEEMCAALSPFHAFAHMDAEFDAKNLSREGGGLRALGRDVSRGLPGLYWLNFFGEPYRDLIGRERLLSAPAHEVQELDAGVLLLIHPDPEAWDTPAYRDAEDRILAHIGRRYFFSRDDPDRETVAPAFELPPLADPSQRRFQVYYPGGNAEPGAGE